MLTRTKTPEKKRVSAKNVPAHIFTIYQVAELFELPDIDDVDERLWESKETNALSSVCWHKDWKFDYNSWSVTKDCEACDGDGYVDSLLPDENGEYDWLECDTCGGSGEVEVDIEDIRNSDEYEKAYIETGDELYDAWRKSVEHVLERHAGYIGLTVREVDIVHIIQGGTDKGKPYLQTGYQLVSDKSWHDVCDRLIDIINGYGYFWFKSVKELMESIPTTSPKQAALDHLHWVKHYNYVYGGSKRYAENVYEEYMEHYLRSW